MDLLREFIRYSFYVVERDDCTISKLLLLAVKWNASNSNQPTTDHNKSVIKVFNNKKNLLIGLSSLDKICDRFLDKLLEIQQREIQKEHTETKFNDSIIRIFLRVFKSDIEEAREFFTALVYDNTIHPTQLFTFCNETARKAQNTNVKWIDKLSDNSQREKIRKLPIIRTDEWCVTNVSSNLFDEDKHRQDQRADELAWRQFKNFQQYIVWTQQRNNNSQPRFTATKETIQQSPQKYDTFASTTQTNTQQSKKKKKSQRKKMFEFMKKATGSDKWKDTYCGYYHFPGTTCQKDEGACTRSHSCPLCKGKHLISQCNKKKK